MIKLNYKGSKILQNKPLFKNLGVQKFEWPKNYSNSAQTEISRLPAQYNIFSLTPDHNYISGPNAISNDPRDWLLEPTGIIFKINAKKLPVKTGPRKRKRAVSSTAGPSRKITP